MHGLSVKARADAVRLECAPFHAFQSSTKTFCGRKIRKKLNIERNKYGWEEWPGKRCATCAIVQILREKKDRE